MPGTSRSGRRPQPESIRSLKGSRTRKHHAREAHYDKVAPEMPDFIKDDPLAAERWRVLSFRLAQAGVLTEAHGEILSLLCASWADLQRSRQQFAEMGYRQLVVDETTMPNGEIRRKVKTNPLIGRIEKQAYQVARFLGEFGLTPMTSAKVAAKEALLHDPFDDLLDEPIQ